MDLPLLLIFQLEIGVFVLFLPHLFYQFLNGSEPPTVVVISSSLLSWQYIGFLHGLHMQKNIGV